MKQQETFNKIGEIIKELNEQYKYLEGDPGNINEPELELFVANTHFLAGHAGILQKLCVQANANQAVKQPEAKKEEKYFEPFVHQPESISEAPEDRPVSPIDIATAAPADDYSYMREEPEIIKHELEVDESWIDDDEEQADAEEEIVIPYEPIKPRPVNEIPPTERPDIKHDDEVITINQKISAQLAKSTATELTQQPINDLKSAITLNDKLLYIKDLFNGYSLAYNEAIDILNRFHTYEEADSYLKINYAVKNKWADKPETTEKFYELLGRRYI